MEADPNVPPEVRPERGPGARRLAALLRLAAALAIVIVLVRAVGPQSVLARIGACPPEVALAAFVAAIGSQWLAALRLRTLAEAQGFALSGSEALLIGLSAVFYSLFVPGGNATSWTVRLLRLSRGTNNMVAGLQLLTGDRALSTASGAAIGLATGLAIGESTPRWITVLLLVVTVGASLLCVIMYAPSAASPVSLARRISWLDRIAIGLIERGSLLRRPDWSTVLRAIGLSLLAHASGVLAWLVLAPAVGIDLDVVTIAWVRSAAMVATLLPATVGGLGLRDAAVVYLMAPLGVAASDALAFSLLVFATSVLLVGVAGGAMEVRDLLRRRP